MTISLQDQNIIVSYIQTYLRDYFGTTLVKSTSNLARATDDVYEITQSKPLRVTGRYTTQTYTSVALYMAYNYPYEQFPVRYDRRNPTSDVWDATPFDYQRLKTTMDLLIKSGLTSQGYEITEDMFNQIIADSGNPIDYYLTWDQLVKYYPDEDTIYEALVDQTEFTTANINTCLITFLVQNLNSIYENKSVCDINSRILSYFVEEVVTPMSPTDEIFRIQKIMYPLGLPYTIAGRYTEVRNENNQLVEGCMMYDVAKAQQNFIDYYTITDRNGVSEVSLPEGYEGFKVTGYVDPWTELILKGGID